MLPTARTPASPSPRRWRPLRGIPAGPPFPRPSFQALVGLGDPPRQADAEEGEVAGSGVRDPLRGFGGDGDDVQLGNGSPFTPDLDQALTLEDHVVLDDSTEPVQLRRDPGSNAGPGE